MSGAVILERYLDKEEALIVCALLKDAGIDAHLDNWHHASAHWYVTTALGGVGVLVSEADANNARDIIQEYVSSAEERLLAEFQALPAEKPDRKLWFKLSFFGFEFGWSLILLTLVMAVLLAGFGIVSDAQNTGFSLQLALSHLAQIDWVFGLALLAWNSGSFLVLLGIFVFLARRFLNQRARQKQSA